MKFYDAPGGTGSQIGPVFSVNAAKAPTTGTYPAQPFNFGTPYAAMRSVVFTANNHNPGSNFVAMREIVFTGSVAPALFPTPDKVIVYFVGGQSNADGYGQTARLPAALQMPQPDIDFHHGNGGGYIPWQWWWLG